MNRNRNGFNIRLKKADIGCAHRDTRSHLDCPGALVADIYPGGGEFPKMEKTDS
jgi:hypothetical protein